MTALNKSGGLVKRAVYALLLLVLGLAAYFGVNSNNAPTVTPLADGVESIEQVYQQRQSNVWVEVDGVAVKLLPDDNDSSRHQRFILKIDNGRTLLVAHNIDLASRVPLSVSDNLSLRGRYEWNEKGGVLHWTHHDPSGEIAGGWIEYKGKRYQ